MTAPTQDELRALGLDDASLDAQWREVMAQLCAEGVDVDAMTQRAGAVLARYHDHPAPVGDGFALIIDDRADLSVGLGDVTTAIDGATGRWGDDHKHNGVPVHPGCYGCQSCFDCTTNPESPCYVRLTAEELAAIPPAVIDDSEPF